MVVHIAPRFEERSVPAPRWWSADGHATEGGGLWNWTQKKKKMKMRGQFQVQAHRKRQIGPLGFSCFLSNWSVRKKGTTTERRKEWGRMKAIKMWKAGVFVVYELRMLVINKGGWWTSKRLRTRMGWTEDVCCSSAWKWRRIETEVHGYRKYEERGEKCKSVQQDDCPMDGWLLSFMFGWFFCGWRRDTKVYTHRSK